MTSDLSILYEIGQHDHPVNPLFPEHAHKVVQDEGVRTWRIDTVE